MDRARAWWLARAVWACGLAVALLSRAPGAPLAIALGASYAIPVATGLTALALLIQANHEHPSEHRLALGWAAFAGLACVVLVLTDGALRHALLVQRGGDQLAQVLGLLCAGGFVWTAALEHREMRRVLVVPTVGGLLWWLFVCGTPPR